MGTVSRDNNQNQNQAPKPKAVNIFDKGLAEGTRSVLDTKADAWATPPPPPKGVYQVKAFVSNNDGTMAHEGKEGKGAWYSFNLELHIQDGAYKGSVVFDDRCNTMIRRGLNISTCAGVLAKNKIKVPKEATDLEIARLFATWLKKEPIVNVLIDWKAYSREQKKELYKKMEDFPPDGKGGFQHLVTVRDGKGVPEDLIARAYVKSWLSIDEAGEMKDKVGKSSPVSIPVVEDDEEEEDTKGKKEEVEEDDEEEAKPVEEVKKKKKKAVEEEATPPKKAKKSTPPAKEEDEDEDEDEEIDESALEDDDDDDDDEDED